ncbi:hypothetical protein [Enterococcus casseliflavus]|uniref:hypothetical protein n=1 Tax=Enterococcus casseliflavus TaxID=37734 RepID=UPI00232EE084|nr:hypothetical protein [Enterococcus casseliflavus]MDB1690069.1 hypothetical protein [Enterococcus casseliflavus]
MEKENRKRRREKLYRLVALAEHPDFDTNQNIRAEWELLKGGNECPTPNTANVQVEVLYEGNVIFTGNREEVRKEIGISHSNMSRKLRENRPDRKKRYYRIKE